MSITVRQAESADAAFLSVIEQTAGRSQLDRGFWDLALPIQEHERLATMQKILISDTPSMFHFSCFIIAEVDGKPAAALSGYNIRNNSNKNLIQALREINFNDGQIREFVMNLAPFMTCYPETLPDVWIIESVAALKEFRNRGLVSLLLKHIIQAGREQGYKLCQIAVQIGNAPARHTYTKAGFRFIDSKTSPEYEKAIGAPGLERLQMEL